MQDEHGTKSALAGRIDHWLAMAALEVGREGFHRALIRGLRAAVGAEHISHISYNRRGEIDAATALSWRIEAQPLIDATTDLFVRRWYRRDPNYELVCSATPPAGAELPRLQTVSVAPAGIADPEYRRLMFERPGFGSKVSLISSWAAQTCYFNLYFSAAQAPVERVQAMLQDHGASLLALAHAHERLCAQRLAPPQQRAELSLSTRERQVLELLREGQTAKQIARELCVAPTTVVTYRQRLYEKLGVGNLKELLRGSLSV